MAHRPYNVLVVDDEQPICDIIVHALPKGKYKVDVAYDGEEGLKLAESKQYDAVFMDLRMPVLDGCEAIKRLKTISPEVVIIVMTGASNKEMIESALANGANSVIVKPFRISEVQSILKTVSY